MAAPAPAPKALTNPLECKSKLEALLARATVELQTLLGTQMARLQAEYEAIRAAHFPCVRPLLPLHR